MENKDFNFNYSECIKQYDKWRINMNKKIISKELILILSAFISTILSGWSIYHLFVFYLLYSILWEAK